MKIKVKAKRATPKISNVKNIYIKSKSQMTKKIVLKNVVITQKGIKLDAKYVKVTFKKLKKNKKYYVQARAFTVINGNKKYGPWSAKKKMKLTK